MLAIGNACPATGIRVTRIVASSLWQARGASPTNTGNGSLRSHRVADGCRFHIATRVAAVSGGLAARRGSRDYRSTALETKSDAQRRPHPAAVDILSPRDVFARFASELRLFGCVLALSLRLRHRSMLTRVPETIEGNGN